MGNQAYIQFIIEEIKKGNYNLKEICSLFCTKFHKSERTFYKYYDEARELYTKSIKLINFING